MNYFFQIQIIQGKKIKQKKLLSSLFQWNRGNDEQRSKKKHTHTHIELNYNSRFIDACSH